MGALTVFWLLVSALAWRRQWRTGERSQWRYVALIGAGLTLFVMIMNLHGVVFTGPGGHQ